MDLATVAVDGIVLTMRKEEGFYRWFWPDGTPTDFKAADRTDAERTMMYGANAVAEQWKKRQAI